MKFNIAFVLAALTATIAAQAVPPPAPAAPPAAGAPAPAPKVRKLPCGFSCINAPIKASNCEQIGVPAGAPPTTPPSPQVKQQQRDCFCTLSTLPAIFEANGCVAQACAKTKGNPATLAKGLNKMCGKSAGFKPFAV